MKLTRYFPLVLLLCCTATAFAADDKAKTGGESAVAHDHGTWKEKRFVAVPGVDGIQRVEIVGGEYFFDPNYIVVKKNRPVELKFRKEAGYIPHNMVVKAAEAGINFNVEMKKETQAVKFTPTKAGKYPMYCDKSLLWFKTHQEKGMDGIIEVVE